MVKDKIRELNKGWVVDFNNVEQRKHYMVFLHEDMDFHPDNQKEIQCQDKELICKSNEVLKSLMQEHFTIEELKLAYGIK